MLVPICREFNRFRFYEILIRLELQNPNCCSTKNFNLLQAFVEVELDDNSSVCGPGFEYILIVELH